jgi:hypothetical protein
VLKATNVIGFAEFVGTLSKTKVALPAPRTDAFRLVPTALKEFVAPDLEHRTDISEPPQGQVILITAPAAVGKTTFASQLAHELNCPIWDLSKAPSIGSGALDGQMSANFGREAAAKFLTLAEQGEACILIHALDEARIRITESTFSDFLRSISEIVRKSPRCACIVLGRKQVIEDAWLYFSVNGVTTPIYEICYFDKPKSIRFLDNYVSKFGPEQAGARQAFHQAYDRARDSILEAIEKSVPEEKAADFIGYAPVLMAIARALSEETNFHAVSSRWSGGVSSSDGGPISIVASLIVDILFREQSKYILNAPADVKFAISGSPAPDVYSPREQEYRILCYMLNRDDLARQFSVSLPSDISESYEESSGSLLREHPFLAEGTRAAANVIFKDYLYAVVLNEGGDFAEEILKRASEFDDRPSPLLFEFYFRSGEREVEREIDARHIGILYDSALGSETIDKNVQFSIETIERGYPRKILLKGTFEFFTEEDAETITHPRVVQFVADPIDNLEFSRVLSHADIDVDNGLQLVSPSKEFEFIGDVWISAGNVDFDVDTIVVRPHRAERSSENANPTVTSIIAGTVTGKVSRPPKVYGSLQVEFPGSDRYPWIKFKSNISVGGSTGNDYERSERILRRIITAFRSHSRGSLARFKDKIESERVSRGTLGKCLLGMLISDRILRLEGKFYYLDPAQCSNRLGVTYYDLKNRALTEKARGYLDSFLAKQ